MAAWNWLLQQAPELDFEYGLLLRMHAERQIHAITNPLLGGEVLPYSKVAWSHTYPDKRAHALYQSHHILFVEFCLAADAGEFVIQATVHPSMRNYLLHYPTLHPPLRERNKAFSMTSHTCSCEDGCVVSGSLSSDK